MKIIAITLAAILAASNAVSLESAVDEKRTSHPPTYPPWSS